MIKRDIKEIIREKILVLDGGLGTMIQGHGLGEEDYRGERFAGWKIPLKGCNDILVLTRPDVVRSVHDAYFAAGADIVSTDSFNANALSLADYDLQSFAYEINREAARIAREVADGYIMRNRSKPRFVAGSVGPTSRTASMSADVNNPSSREVTFDDLAVAYREQVRGLLDGGADIILVETVFDTLNAKAALFAVSALGEERGVKIPVMISGTLADASGRTLSGQVVEAFYTSIAHAEPLSVGFNCAYGARQLLPYLQRLAEISEFPVSAHPNAGLPNVMGGYDETPEMMAADIEEYLKLGLVNIVGGCCGTTPVHIAGFAAKAKGYKPRAVPVPSHETVLSGLEPLRITKDSNFVNIGERTNVAGSAIFAKMIREGRYEDALSVARQQVESGAQIVDVCMDDGLIDGVAAMTRFLNYIMAEPEIARVPVMIDSSSWEVLEAGLKCVQGKSVVNSISLKEGEAEFLRKARLIRRYGASAVVMLFDETGQADTFARKTEVAARAYKLLTTAGFPAEDIIFDPNVLSVATGIAEHNSYGADFIEAVRWIKTNLPHCKVSGGISNLSFAFRGNNKIREAMHSVFLYHAIEAGLDMGIVNPAMLQVYSEIEPELLELAGDVVLNRREDATERLSDYAERVKGEAAAPGQPQKQDAWRDGTLEDKISYSMMKGVTDHTEEDILAAYGIAGSPLAVIDNYLMPVMGRIGELFGEGKMFLPQVVKSARVMKRAVDVLTPYIAEQNSNGAGSSSAGKVLIATVKGDVHDIGKNIVSVVMSCNGYDVKDLGVMVDANIIADQAGSWGADVVGLSGLISPSLDEMIKVAAEFERRGLKIPIIIGGATTSELHTAIKIAPVYSGQVIHSRDASENISILNKLFGRERELYLTALRQRQEELLAGYMERESVRQLWTIEDARRNRYVKQTGKIIDPEQVGIFVYNDFPVSEVEKYIDWNFFFPAWEMKGRFPEILDSPEKGEEARKLFDEAKRLLDRIKEEKLLTLNGVAAILPAWSEGDDIVVEKPDGSTVRLPQLRQQEARYSEIKREHPKAELDHKNLSLADFVAGRDGGKRDHVCAFALTSGIGLGALIEGFREKGDEYSAIMAKLLADRLAEAFAEALHMKVRRELWGFEKTAPLSAEAVLKGSYQGIRVAFGYPSCPDHSLKREVMDLLDAEDNTGMTLNSNYMISPGESVCGLVFAGDDTDYFSVGMIGDDQLEDYAGRRGMTIEELRKLIPRNIR